jgi:hypothetical protein
VASLGTVVLDVIRYELLQNEEGVAFGLLGASSNFTNVGCFWSPSFLLHFRTPGPVLRKAWLSTILVISGLIAVFAGHSSALLMIPQSHDGWPAGGIDFQVAGNRNHLWPLHVNLTSIGGEHYFFPTEQIFYRNYPNMSGCNWYGVPNLEATLKEKHLAGATFDNITIIDHDIERSIETITVKGQTDTLYDGSWWLVAPSLTIGSFAKDLSRFLLRLLNTSPAWTRKGTSEYNLKHRMRGSATANVMSPSSCGSCTV